MELVIGDAQSLKRISTYEIENNQSISSVGGFSEGMRVECVKIR